jgi:hypothetical protein
MSFRNQGLYHAGLRLTREKRPLHFRIDNCPGRKAFTNKNIARRRHHRQETAERYRDLFVPVQFNVPAEVVPPAQGCTPYPQGTTVSISVLRVVGRHAGLGRRSAPLRLLQERPRSRCSPRSLYRPAPGYHMAKGRSPGEAGPQTQLNLSC